MREEKKSMKDGDRSSEKVTGEVELAGGKTTNELSEQELEEVGNLLRRIKIVAVLYRE